MEQKTVKRAVIVLYFLIDILSPYNNKLELSAFKKMSSVFIKKEALFVIYKELFATIFVCDGIQQSILRAFLFEVKGWWPWMLTLPFCIKGTYRRKWYRSILM
jgi:hypothetical protein